MSNKKETRYSVNDGVTYIAYEGATPEHGVVSSIRDNDNGTQSVWVKYSNPGTGQLTPVSRLHK